MRHELRLLPLVLALSGSLASAQTPCGDLVLLNELDAGTVGPVLRTHDGAPVVGGPFSFRVEGALPNMAGALIYSGFESPFVDPGYGATFWFGIPYNVIYFDTDASGRSPGLVVVPELDPFLCGEFAVFQAGVFDPGATGGVAVTNAIRLRIGDPGALALPQRHLSSYSQFPRAFVSADLDGDGLNDLVTGIEDYTVSPKVERVYVRLGLPTGGVSDTIISKYSQYLPYDFAAADFDGDGALDVVTAEREGRATVHWGDGTGTLPSRSNLTTASGSRAVAVADFDADGALDVVTADSLSDGLSVVLGDGLGGFAAAVPVTVGLEPHDVVATDLDGDGAVDLVATVLATDQIAVRAGQGNGAFDPVVTYAAGDEPWHLVVDDLDGDGELDVANTNRTSQDVTVLLGQGGGVLGVTSSLPVGGAAFGIVATDANLDGDLDLLAGVQDPDEVRFLFGDGAGGFSSSAGFDGAFPTLASIVSFQLDDLDRDGLPDLLMLSGDPKADGTDNGGYVTTWRRDAELGFDPERFARSLPVQLPSRPGLELVDVDGDGRLDVVVPEPNEVTVFASTGGASFAAPVSSSHGFTDWVGAVGDLDNDGLNDVLVAADGVRSMLGTGGGAFAAPGVATDSGSKIRAELADLNGDGNLDAFVRAGFAFFAIGLSEYPGNGDGTFGPGTIRATLSSTFPGFSEAELGDLDGDGFLDLLSATGSPIRGQFPPPHPYETDILTRLGDGLGGFASPSQTIEFQSFSSIGRIAVVDVNEDGAADAVMDWGSVAVYEGNGDGTLGSLSIGGKHGGGSGRFRFADVDGDGHLDVVRALSLGMVVVPGNGDATFDDAVNYRHPTHNVEHNLELGDIDLDGIPDFVFLSQDHLGETSVRVVLNDLGE